MSNKEYGDLLDLMSGQAVTSTVNEAVIVLEPGRAERNYWRDLWRY